MFLLAFNVFLELLDLGLILRNDLLAEVTSLGKFMFDLSMVLQVLSQSFDDFLHLMVFEHLMLSLLRLVLKLASQ